MTTSILTDLLNTAANQTDWPECARQCRQVLVSAIDYIFENAGIEKPKGASLLELIESPVVTACINDADLISSLHYVRILGMNAEHGRSVRRKEASLALENVTYIVGLLKAKETGTDTSYRKPPYMSEAATRRLYVDQYLKEAGWDILDTDNVAQPGKAGIEIEVQGMPNPQGKGYCDYVLYGKDGRPLAIVEVKKTSEAPEKGRHQVELYADCMEKQYGYRPVRYYTNGYTTKIIDGIYPDREIHAFHAREELERLIQRRSLGPIKNLKINQEITGRPYQTIAITNICEWLSQKHRRGLLVMATGTGKTRVAISLVDVLTRNKWVKNVLFLADRISLVNQAKRNFANLMPDMSICELSAPGDKDLNARLIFCTYQTMINYIDAEDKTFTTGRFDLIIIDEAHRSIFNRYGTIFKYFDSLLIGLTATPKNEVDANTYKIFGCEAGMPNFDYPLEEAIQDKYLVGYHVINRTSKLLQQGIKYDELTPEQREQLEDYLPDDTPSPEFDIPSSELFKYLFNEDTCRKVLEELMRWGYRVDEGETMGKTIIFAYNHKHAQMIVDLFREMYPLYHESYCQLVDYSVNYGEDLVIKFGEDPNFRIAVSVDMLDTGIDVPAVLNLVFFKKVRSKIKFVQMIGRGTRLCKDVYGPGKNKNGFLIFDYCGNFEYFGEHPDGKEGKEMLTLSQRLFQIRLDMLFELQKLEYQEDTWFHAYYDQIKTELHNEVIHIKSHDSRIQVRESMQYVDKYYDKKSWISLSPVEVKEIKRHISPLLDSGLNGDHLAVSFDARVYYVEKTILATGKATGANDHTIILDDSNYSATYIPDIQWNIKSHDAARHGTNLLISLLAGKRFSFPKSLYATHDAIRFFVANKPNALIVDFFAGSGTTLHAVNLLNAEDKGHRRCILVTNNEVSVEETNALTEKGYYPGDNEWDKMGIACYVTWPRTVCSIRGHDINGQPLKGNYIGTDRPMSDGFAANAAFFKLGFLDKASVRIGRQFREMLPTLWMKAGCHGPCPTLEDDNVPEILILPQNHMAVLNDNSAYATFEKLVEQEPDIDTVYLVTDSDADYRFMSKGLSAPYKYQLYRDYLDNFRINSRR